jgi:hypothetical protein
LPRSTRASISRNEAKWKGESSLNGKFDNNFKAFVLQKVVPEEYFLGHYHENNQPQEFLLDENGLKKTNVQASKHLIFFELLIFIRLQ